MSPTITGREIVAHFKLWVTQRRLWYVPSADLVAECDRIAAILDSSPDLPSGLLGVDPHPDPAANRAPDAKATEWSAVDVALLAESALMESSGTPNQQVQAALAVILASLPKETDPGVYYDNARRKAEVLRRLLKCPVGEVAGPVRRCLLAAIEQAEYVGD